jgi:hypothetical protein
LFPTLCFGRANTGRDGFFEVPAMYSSLHLEQGREKDHWDMATELVAIEDGQQATLKPIQQNLGPMGEPIEPLEAVQNAGEFPTLTDQDETENPKQTRKRRR